MSSISVDDLRAQLGDLWALLRLATAGTAQNSKPLSRYRYIDGGTTTPAAQQNGASGTPFSTIGAFMAFIGVGTSAADSQTTFIGCVTPAVAGYTENVAFPSRRNTELRTNSTQIQAGLTITGNVTWASSAAGGGVLPPLAAALILHNIVFSGTGTFTDDGTGAETIVISADEFAGSAGITGAVTATGATDLASISLLNAALGSTLTSTANATGVQLLTNNCTMAGAVVARNVIAQSTLFNGNVTVASSANGGNPKFTNGCTFGTISLTGGAGSIATFDGSSWINFLESASTLVSMIVLVQGGYNGGAVVGAALSAANGINGNVTVSINGTGASAAFVTGGNWYTVPTATLTGARTVTLATGAGEKKGDTILITRVDATANTLTVANGGGGGGNVAILPISVKGSVLAEFDGTNWVLAESAAAT